MQYPNAFAAVAAAYLIWSWGLLIRARTRICYLLAAIQGVPLALVLLLTESRAAWLAAGLGWLGGLAAARRTERVHWLLYSGWTLVAAGAAYRFVYGAGLRNGGHAAAGAAPEAVVAEGALLLACVLAGAGGYYLIRSLAPRSSGRWRVWAAWGGWIAGIGAMALLLPAVIQGRLGGYFDTLGARSMFYKDAIILIREAPLLGRGGDTWRMLFTQIQTYPYIGSEVHSGYLDIALDLGLVGLVLFGLVIGGLLRNVFLFDRMGLVPIGVLLLHAAVDFDMAYGCYWLLLFGWIALYSKPAEAGGGTAAGRWRRRAAVRGAAAASAAVIAVTAALCSWRFDAAVAHREAAVYASGAGQAAALRAALGANPYWTRIRIELAELAPPQEQAALLAAGLRYEPQSVPLLRALGRVYAERGDVPQATAHLRLALRYDRYDRDNQTDAVVHMARLAQHMRAIGKASEARQAAQTALSFFEAFEAQGIDAEAAGRDFEVTPESLEAANAAGLLLRQLGAGPGY
nr:O-antigen ligase family protein [Paenibacillus oenotherae]